jgi:hypothetical protein
MNGFDGRTAGPARGLSRRQVLGRALAGMAGGLLASLGLIGGAGEVRAAQVVSLRAVMQQLSPHCDLSHGLRLILPDVGDPPVISLLDVIHRFYHG